MRAPTRPLGGNSGPPHTGLSTPLPPGLARCWFALGAAPLLLLVVLGLTGAALALHYRPGLRVAADSVNHITSQVPLGWYVRALHHWAAALLGVTTTLHLLRVAFSRAYRGVRAPTWLLGGLLLGLLAFAVLTGEVLVGDAHGYWALRMTQQAAVALPWVGGWLAELLLGATLPVAAMLARVHVLHVLFLPAVLATFTGMHLARVRRDGFAEASTVAGQSASGGTGSGARGAVVGPERRGALGRSPGRTIPYWRLELMTACLLLVVLNLLAVHAAPVVVTAVDPSLPPVGIRPSWVAAAPAWWFDSVPQPAAQLGALMLVVLLLGWPQLDRWANRTGRSWLASPWWMAAGVLTVVAVGFWRLWTTG